LKLFIFDPEALEQFTEWATLDKKKFHKIFSLLKEVARTPLEGNGKPEPLTGNLSGCWSRRIDDKHRLVIGLQIMAILKF
jgi:toxin YoeB